MKQDVGRGEIAVKDAFLDELNEPLEDMAHVLEGLGWGEFFFAEKFLEISTFAKLLYKVKMVVGFQEV